MIGLMGFKLSTWLGQRLPSCSVNFMYVVSLGYLWINILLFCIEQDNQNSLKLEVEIKDGLFCF